MVKIIASDYDGTLNQQGTVSEDDINAIKSWQNDGNLFGLVTGRSISGIRPEIEHYNIPYDFLICNNGCEIYNDKEELLYRADSDPIVLKPLVDLIIEHKGLHAAISSEQTRFSIIYDGQEVPISPGDVWINKAQIDDITYFTQIDTHFYTNEEAEEFAKIVNAKFSDYLTAFDNGVNVDIVPRGVSKTNGIYKLVEVLGNDNQQVYPIGDNFNDLAMLKEFDGYVVKSGNPKVVKLVSNKCEGIGDLVSIIS